MSFFEYLAAHPDDAAVFNAAMTSVSSVELPAIIAAYDFSGFHRIVDVGGGEGALLHGILSANPKLRGCSSIYHLSWRGRRSFATGLWSGAGRSWVGHYF